MNKKVKFMAIFIIALFTSFISFSGDILTFETYSKNIEENISNGTMSFIENRQCLVTLWKKTVSSSGENRLTITASCIEDQNSKINWDYPDVNRKEAVSVIYIYGNDMVESIDSKLNEGKITLFFKKLAYHNLSHFKKNCTSILGTA